MSTKAAGTQQPIARPTARCLPDLVSGMPISRDSFAFAEEMPVALFQENETPGMPFFLRATIFLPRLTKISQHKI